MPVVLEGLHQEVALLLQVAVGSVDRRAAEATDRLQAAAPRRVVADSVGPQAVDRQVARLQVVADTGLLRVVARLQGAADTGLLRVAADRRVAHLQGADSADRKAALLRVADSAGRRVARLRVADSADHRKVAATASLRAGAMASLRADSVDHRKAAGNSRGSEGPIRRRALAKAALVRGA